jgi:hypothetical protein
MMAKTKAEPDNGKSAALADRDTSATETESRVAQWLLDAKRERPAPPTVEYGTDEAGGFTVALDKKRGRKALLALHSATGLRNYDAAFMLLDQLLRLSASDFSKLDPANADGALALLDELKPSDGPEAMLAAQMVAVHVASMQCFSRALLSDQTFAGRELNLKHGAKLSRIYAQQVEALDKHRRKGQQTVVVEHVHVNDGGQAIVGSVSNGKGV